MRAILAAIMSVVIAPTTLVTQRAAPESTPPALAVQFTAYQAWVDAALIGPLPKEYHTSRTFAVALLESSDDRLSAWRLRLRATSHAHPYIVASIQERVFRLGGFAEPQLRELSRSIPRAIRGPSDATQRAQAFATLIDPNGAATIRSNRSPTSDDADTNRTAVPPGNLPRGWPQDTVVVFGDTLYQITLNVMSFADWVLRGAWQPIGYTFLLSSRGEVLAWSRREGEYYPAVESRLRGSAQDDR